MAERGCVRVYWFNVDSGIVEQDGATDSKGNLLGPYGTEEEARVALASAAMRTAEWDQADKEWDER